MWSLIGIFWQTGIIFLNLSDKILIYLKISCRQNINAGEKRSLFWKFTLWWPKKNQSFQNHYKKILQTQVKWEYCTCYLWILLNLCLCLIWHNKGPKKRGKSWKYPSSTLHLKATSGRKSSVMRLYKTLR